MEWEAGSQIRLAVLAARSDVEEVFKEKMISFLLDPVSEQGNFYSMAIFFFILYDTAMGRRFGLGYTPKG